MEYFLSLSDLDTGFQSSLCNLGVEGCLFVINGDAALLNETSCLASGGSQLAGHHQIQDSDGILGELIPGDLSGRHIGIIAAAHEQCVDAVLALSASSLP